VCHFVYGIKNIKKKLGKNLNCCTLDRQPVAGNKKGKKNKKVRNKKSIVAIVAKNFVSFYIKKNRFSKIKKV